MTHSIYRAHATRMGARMLARMIYASYALSCASSCIWLNHAARSHARGGDYVPTTPSDLQRSTEASR